MSAAQVNTLMDAAISALEAGDYATALDKAVAAQGRLSVMPDSRWGDNHELRWKPEGIADFIRNLNARQQAAAATAAGGIRRTKVNYVRPTS